MKALSLTQPWAQLVVTPRPLEPEWGLKEFETRSFSTSYSGLLFIHASKNFPKWARLLCGEEPFFSSLEWRSPVSLPTGAIIGAVDLLKCYPTSPEGNALLTDRELAFGDFGPKRFAWRLKNPRLLPEPLACKGALGLWTVPEEVKQELRGII